MNWIRFFKIVSKIWRQYTSVLDQSLWNSMDSQRSSSTSRCSSKDSEESPKISVDCDSLLLVLTEESQRILEIASLEWWCRLRSRRFFRDSNNVCWIWTHPNISLSLQSHRISKNPKASLKESCESSYSALCAAIWLLMGFNEMFVVKNRPRHSTVQKISKNPKASLKESFKSLHPASKNATWILEGIRWHFRRGNPSRTLSQTKNL